CTHVSSTHIYPLSLHDALPILDEYVAMHPEDLQRIQALVARQQLFIGPWYTQTDAMIPDSEAIIRNLVIGINDTRQKYGQPMMRSEEHTSELQSRFDLVCRLLL